MTFNANEILQLLILFYNWPFDADPEKNLQALGSHLQALSTMPLSDFWGFSRMICSTLLHSSIGQVERQMEEYKEGPPIWRRDIKAYRVALHKQAKQGDFSALPDLQGSPEERSMLFQELVGQYGRLLSCWPALVAAARAIR